MITRRKNAYDEMSSVSQESMSWTLEHDLNTGQVMKEQIGRCDSKYLYA